MLSNQQIAVKTSAFRALHRKVFSIMVAQGEKDPRYGGGVEHAFSCGWERPGPFGFKKFQILHKTKKGAQELANRAGLSWWQWSYIEHVARVSKKKTVILRQSDRDGLRRLSRQGHSVALVGSLHGYILDNPINRAHALASELAGSSDSPY